MSLAHLPPKVDRDRRMHVAQRREKLGSVTIVQATTCSWYDVKFPLSDVYSSVDVGQLCTT